MFYGSADAIQQNKISDCISEDIPSQMKILNTVILDIRSEIMFYGSADTTPQNKISDNISDDIPSQMKILNTFIPDIC